MWSQTKGWLYDSPLYARMTKRKPSSLQKGISLQETAPALESLSSPARGRKFSALSFWGPAALLILTEGPLWPQGPGTGLSHRYPPPLGNIKARLPVVIAPMSEQVLLSLKSNWHDGHGFTLGPCWDEVQLAIAFHPHCTLSTSAFRASGGCIKNSSGDDAKQRTKVKVRLGKQA